MSIKPYRRIALAALLLLTGARDDSCSMSLGPDGLCASLRLDPEATSVRVGDTFRVQINADGCSATTGCACGDSAMAEARWSSENPSTATVDSTGLVHARRPGTAAITVTPNRGSWVRTRIQVTVVP